MGVSVVIPWRDTDPYRRAALRWVTGQWERHGLITRLGVHNKGMWCKALAVQAALGSGDVLVVADADVWSDGATEAIEHVRAGAAWAMPHTYVHRLTHEYTRRVLAGAAPKESMPVEDLVPGVNHGRQWGVEGGGMVVLNRDVYNDCPLDPRFRGWGQEDEAWALALRCLHGPPVRLDYPLWHLWHPPQERKERGIGSDAGQALYKRYYKARRRPEWMRALIDEGRVHADSNRDRQDAGHVSVSAP